MRDRESIVDINVAELGELCGKRRVVLLFAGVEAGVFQAQNFAGLHGGNGLFGDFADAVFGKSDRPADNARHRGDDGLERLARIAALGPAVMRKNDHLAAAVGDFGDARRVPLDARNVGDFAIVHRHVEIDAHQHALALHVGVVEAAERHDEEA